MTTTGADGTVDGEHVEVETGPDGVRIVKDWHDVTLTAAQWDFVAGHVEGYRRGVGSAPDA